MSAFAFAFPAVLTTLVLLPVIWWLLRLTPPKPQAEVFPPFAILASILKREETPAQSPWWLTLLRMLMAAAVIFAIADPVFNPRTNTLASSGPLALVVDNTWASATDWQNRVDTAATLIDDAESRNVPIALMLTA
uniref:BatA domain-containing protein n=1 Tax=Shinella sp. TaxID=1870904 RepID=UPI00289E5308